MSSINPTTGWPASTAEPGLAGPLGALAPGQPDAVLVDVVARALADHPPEEPVLVAASGGPDSAGLLRLAARARPAGAALIAGHVRHGLRADDHVDRDHARAQADAVGAGWCETQVTVRHDGDGPAGAARRARLDALARLAVDAGSSAVLLAHTADDRAETIALNLARGCGLDGLAAMPAVRAHGGVLLRRPLLTVRRGDVRRVAADGPVAVADPGNVDRQRRRTRARQEVLPALARLSGGDGDPVATLTRLGDLASADGALLDELAAREARRHRRDWPPLRALDAAAVDAAPLALARRMVRALLVDATGAVPPAAAVEAVLALAAGQRRTVAGGVAVARQAGWLVARPPAAEPVPERRLARRPTPAGPVVVRLAAIDGDAADGPPSPSPPHRRRLGGPQVLVGPGAATVRGRRPGDRVVIGGTARPLSDLLARAGVPGLLRDLLPVVVDAGGRVAGVPGLIGADPPPRPAAAVRLAASGVSGTAPGSSLPAWASPTGPGQAGWRDTAGKERA